MASLSLLLNLLRFRPMAAGNATYRVVQASFAFELFGEGSWHGTKIRVIHKFLGESQLQDNRLPSSRIVDLSQTCAASVCILSCPRTAPFLTDCCQVLIWMGLNAANNVHGHMFRSWVLLQSNRPFELTLPGYDADKVHLPEFVHDRVGNGFGGALWPSNAVVGH